MKIFEIEQTNNLITMWHGGRGLEYSYNEMLGNKSGSTEYGPGLYLTTRYDTAFKYAKGGGKTYMVSFISGVTDEQVNLKLEDVFHFIKNTILRNKKELVTFIKEDKYNKYSEVIPASNLINLMVNFECMTPSTSPEVRKYLVQSGVDYAVSHRYNGRDETIAVIFNPRVIKKVDIIPAKDVKLDMHELKVPL